MCQVFSCEASVMVSYTTYLAGMAVKEVRLSGGRRCARIHGSGCLSTELALCNLSSKASRWCNLSSKASEPPQAEGVPTRWLPVASLEQCKTASTRLRLLFSPEFHGPSGQPVTRLLLI
jgi:hypothetical protein